jgi:hypothetical protein
LKITTHHHDAVPTLVDVLFGDTHIAHAVGNG